MGTPLSKSQLEKLGHRLRKADVPSEEDMRLLQEFRAAHDPALAGVEAELRQMGLRPSSRLKTPGTILDKLKREKTRLGTMQDIAGIRIVEEVTMTGQDDLVRTIHDRLGGEIIDRREVPKHGYRAVHLVPTFNELRVEIQIRTPLQNLWAQMMEALADRVGRGVRYGELPQDPSERELVKLLLDMSELIASGEARRVQVEGLAERLGALDPGPEASWLLRRTFRRVTRKRELLEQEIVGSELLWRGKLEAILRSMERGDSS